MQTYKQEGKHVTMQTRFENGMQAGRQTDIHEGWVRKVVGKCNTWSLEFRGTLFEFRIRRKVD